jgi:HK97 family phage major capsid protein
MELEQKLTTLQSELKTYFDKAAEEQKTRGSMLEETKTSIMNLQKQVDAIDLKLNERHAQSEPFTDPVEVAMKESESLQRMFKDKRGNAVIHIKGTLDRMQRKTVITENVTGSIGTETGAGVGFATTGVLPIDRIPGITPEARYQLRVRNVLFSRPTTAAVIDFVKVSTPMSIASPVAEGSVKPQNAVAFTAASEKVRTIATWIPATRQVLDDFTELRAYIDGALRYAVDKDEEIELLSGDGTGEHLHGLIPQATAFSTSLLTASAGYQRLDLIATAASYQRQPGSLHSGRPPGWRDESPDLGLEPGAFELDRRWHLPRRFRFAGSRRDSRPHGHGSRSLDRAQRLLRAEHGGYPLREARRADREAARLVHHGHVHN